MSTIIIRPKDRAEWLSQRESGIGSSEVASVLGLNPYQSPYQLWRKKVGIDEPTEENFLMKAGHYLEDAVSQFWQDATGKQIIKRSAGDWLIVNKEREYMRVSPDRTYWLDEGRSHDNKGILECKTTQMKVDADNIPRHWFCQLQYQLGVAEIQSGSLAWLTQGREFDFKEYPFVQDFYSWMVEEVEKFWVDNVQGLNEPVSTTAEDVLLKFSRHTDDKITEVDEATYVAYTNLKDVKKELEALEERKEQLENTLKLGFGDAEAISYQGQTLATWKAAKDSTKFDSKAFCTEHPDMAVQYTKTQQGTRRFLLR